MNLAERTEQQKQELYRTARTSGQYEQIWQNVGECPFCNLHSKYVVLEKNGIVLTIALFAYIDGHLMIIPRRHVKSVKELSPAEWEQMREFMYISKKLIRDVHDIKGMQIIQKDGYAAQSTVEHLHFHCVPFDNPDLNTWNYRQLKNTPLENVAKYRSLDTRINSLSKRYARKYSRGTK